MFSVIVAHDKKRGIAIPSDDGVGKLPWPHNRADIRHFYQITSQTIDPEKCNGVIMGRLTWESINPKYRPLKNRMNIVLSRTMNIEAEATKTCANLNDALSLLAHLPYIEHIFVIGGQSVYDAAINDPRCYAVYTTEFDQIYDSCHKFFPKLPKWFELEDQSQMPIGENTAIKLTFRKYISQLDPYSSETQYLSLLNSIVLHGQAIDNERTGVGTLSLFSGYMRFPVEVINPEENEQRLLKYQVPIMTTKSLFYRGVFEELLMFLRGETNVRQLQKNKISIWDGNTSREYLDKIGLKEYQVGETGPFYGFQWNYFGADYLGADSATAHKKDPRGVNQLEYCINLLKTDPYSRRIVLSAWNPVDLPRMCLPPCHIMYIFKVQPPNKYSNGKMILNCAMTQRSGDMFLGVPFNIFSTALLTIFMSRAADMLPGEISITITDAHIYKNHMEQVKTQLSRTPYKMPILQLDTNIDSLADMRRLDFKKHFKLTEYRKWPAIKAEMAV